MHTGLPEIRDEAPSTPPWVMLLGLGILFVALSAVIYRVATPDEAPAAAAAPAGDAGTDAAPADAGVAAPSVAEEPAPVPVVVE